MTPASCSKPLLWRRVEIPAELCREVGTPAGRRRIAGDVRLGDLTGNGVPDIVVYRSAGRGHDEGGMIPCFIGACDLRGNLLWHVGQDGEQPCRPGPVLVHDINGDGRAEVLSFFPAADGFVSGRSMASACLQIREGATGEVLRQAAPEGFRRCAGNGPNWAHQRLLAADFDGHGRARDAVVKLGDTVVVVRSDLRVRWTYTCPWTEYSRCPSYIPAIGDIDGDGCDEVLGGYYLLDQDGTVLWEHPAGRHMDSVAIERWDHGTPRAICSGYGQVLDAQGSVILALGPEMVPHGQEVRVGRFDANAPEPQMVVRCCGHTTDVMLVNTEGEIVNRFELNPSPNNTGMEVVNWEGLHGPQRLYNGGRLWDPCQAQSIRLPALPTPEPVGRMAWYHCIPANVCGDAREELVLYNPWDPVVWIYTAEPFDEDAWRGWDPGPRQINPRLMD